MSETTGLPPASEAAPVPLTEAVHGFLREFKGFSDDVATRFHEQEALMARLERKMTHAATRPPLGMAAPDADAPAFAAYVRTGEIESKAMSTAVAADGGVLVSPRTAETIRAILVSTASLRSLASVVEVDGPSFDVLIDRGETAAGWATETAAATETGTGVLEKINVPLHELAAQPKVSQRLLDDAAFDVETWLAGRIAEKFVRAESAAFVSGNGVDKPRGILNYTPVANGSWAWGSLGYVVSGVSAGLTTIDPLVDLVYALGAEYRANAAFVMNSRTTAVLRKMKDADGRFLWTDSLAAGEPARLMGYRVLVCEDMPDIAANSYSIAFGDFAAGYTIAERPDLRILRDPFSAKPHVLFYATKRVGGAVTDFGAIKLLKFGTA